MDSETVESFAKYRLNKAKETLEKLYNRSFEIWESNMETQKILREFILKGGFDLNKTIEK